MPRRTAPNADIASLVQRFADDISALVRQAALDEVRAALGDIGAPARRGRPPGRRKAKAGRRKAGGRRSRRTSADRDALAAKLLAHVKAHPGQRGEQIAAALKTDVGTMRPAMKLLIAAKKVRTQGQRRGMTYTAGAARGRPAAKKKAGRKSKRRARKAGGKA